MQITPFSQLYDGTRLFDPTRAMPLWPWQDINVGDVVLLEVRIARTERMGSGVVNYPTSGRIHTVQLELLALCMLAKR